MEKDSADSYIIVADESPREFRIVEAVAVPTELRGSVSRVSPDMEGMG